MIPDLLRALVFAAHKHRDQRRKDPEASPYINHPIEVAELLARVAGVRDLAVLQAAILHDTIEDTETTAEEIEERFGARVRALVEDVTDDKSLPKQRRKQLQIEHAPHLSEGAKLVKLSDKVCNARDMAHSPPPNWPPQRQYEYFRWCRRVVSEIEGGDPGLIEIFESFADEGEAALLAADPSLREPAVR